MGEWLFQIRQRWKHDEKIGKARSTALRLSDESTCDDSSHQPSKLNPVINDKHVISDWFAVVLLGGKGSGEGRMERGLTDATKLNGLIDVHKNTILILQRQEGCALVGPLLITVTSLGVVGEGIDSGNGIIDLFF